jgi:RNA polymerase sigma-70 factor (ECF subfamily)
MAEATDAELLESARAGDGRALEALLERHEPRVYRFGMKMCRDPEDAKDVLQETLLAAARNIRDFRGAASLSTWLYGIARSFCLKQRRKRRAAPGHERPARDAAADPPELTDPRKRPDEALLDRQITRALDDAIGALEPKYREVLLLRDVEGLTAPEVAEVLGLNLEAVKTRLHRARLSVRAQVAPLLGSETPPKRISPPCPDVLSLLSRHEEEQIAPEVCAELERHIVDCAPCRAACDSLRRTLALCRALPAPAPPGPVRDSLRIALREAAEATSRNP